MNCYKVTKCPECQKPIVLDHDTIMTHGWRATEQALQLLKAESVAEVTKKFCQYCGHRKPCGCSCVKEGE